MVVAVIDASVAAKVVLVEAQSEEALRLIEGPSTLIAPAIIRLEVTGAVLRQFRTGRLSEPKAKAACGAWERMLSESLLRTIPVDEVFDLAVRLAFEIRHPLPDCLYLAAAKALKAKLITADKTLFERGRTAHPQIVLLGKPA